MKKIFTLLVCAIVGLNLSAQRVVENYSLFSKAEIQKPFMIDSVDNNGKTFNLLKDFKTLSADKNKATKISVDENGYLVFDKAEKDYVVSLGFRMKSDKRQEVEFKVISNCVFKADFAQTSKEKESQELDTMNVLATYNQGIYDITLNLLIKENSKLKIETENDVEFGDFTMKQGLDLETMLQGKTLNSVSLSPKGNFYVLRSRETDNKGKNNWEWELYTKEHKLIFASEKNYGVAWLPKSELLYYTEKINGENSLVVMNPQDLSTNVIARNIPSGSIYFLDNEQAFIITVADKFEGKKKDVELLQSPEDRSDANWRDRSNLWIYRIGTSSLQRLTFSNHSVYLCDVNSTSDKILFAVSYERYTERPFGYKKFYEMDLNTMQTELICEDKFAFGVEYLGDDKLIFMTSAEGFNSVAAKIGKKQIANMYHYTLVVMNRADKSLNPILKDFNPSLNSYEIIGDKLYMTTTDKDSINVYCMNLATNEIKKIDLPCDMISSFSLDNKGEKAMFIGENYNKPQRLFEYDFSSSKQILFPRQEEYARMEIGEMKVWNFDYKKTTIEGRYYLPADFDSTKQYPMIVYYYAGTTPTDRAFAWRYSPYLYTARGYVVYVLNPSGTIGYGQEFAARHVNAWGERTADEIIEGVKLFCKEHSFVDDSKIGCMGASYGGFMTQYLLTRTDIFTCGISHAGISNITSYWGEGYWGYSYSTAASAHSYPWNNPELYTKQSPLFAADKINAALLLLHGSSDTNVPIGESIQMYNALKLLGKDVAFISVKGEDHGIVDYEKRLQWNNSIYAWFDKYLKGDATMWESLYPTNNLND
ncbi:MAG: S9 family peptidase [Bacteroidales bacterium]|nr:S9 family peptidase [Bacteroidales bacterium]